MTYAVFVTFRIKPGQMEAFLPLMEKQARNSLELETGCRIFEAWCSHSHPEAVELYEIYDDEDAFETHLASDHFIAFDAATRDMVEERRISRCAQRLA